MVTGFFKKLKNKLFNSSSKFTKNLDEVVNEVSETEVEVDVENKAPVETFGKNEVKSKATSDPNEGQVSNEAIINQSRNVNKDNQKLSRCLI